jgi:hypothetical protein
MANKCFLKSTYGPVTDNNEWRIRCELYALDQGMDVITFIKTGRLKWAGHVVRMDQQRPAKRIINFKPEGRGKRGRPKLRWEDGVENDIKALGERNWKT